MVQTEQMTRHTLRSLLELHDVHIPQLQRDYAQGRKNKQNIRKTFVRQLLETLQGEGLRLNLDFVYGYIKNKVYFPLDGQQRLTTLWLLYWYLAPSEACAESQDWLVRFSYRTRSTAERFCKAIVEHMVELRGENVVEAITKHSPWFRSSWSYEPTVSAMLEMLQEIEAQVSVLDRQMLWARLSADVEHAAITFDSIDIRSEDFSLTDELYIKMNARGKALTNWECYKAQLIETLSQVDKTYSYRDSDIRCVDYFSQRIEQEWLDLFWTPEAPDPTKSEQEMLGFCLNIARLCFFFRAGEHLIEDFERVEGNKYRIFAEVEYADRLIYALDFLYKLSLGEGVRAFFSQLATGLSLFSESNLFDEVCKEKCDVRSLVLFFFVLEYTRRHSLTACDEPLRDFVRVLRNQLERTRSFDKGKVLYESNVRINHFNKYWRDWGKLTAAREVYHLLAEQPEDYLNKYEREKAILLRDYPALKGSLQRAEEHPLLRGLIGVLQTEAWAQTLPVWTEALYEIWEQDETIIAQALITCGYQGAFVKEVDYRKREAWFMGSGLRWATILTFAKRDLGKRANLDMEIKEPIRLLLATYLGRREADPIAKLHGIVKDFLDTSEPRDWRYYFCKYPEMLKGKTCYFAWVPGNNFDVRHMSSYSSTPLVAYNHNPYFMAVQGLEPRVQRHESIGADSKVLKVADSLYLDAADKSGWRIVLADSPKLTLEECQKVFRSFGISEDELLLCETEAQDRVMVAADFCREILNLIPQEKND